MTLQRLVIWAIAILTIVFVVGGWLLEWPSPKLFAVWLLVVGAALVHTETHGRSIESRYDRYSMRVPVLAVGVPVVILAILSLIDEWPSTVMIGRMAGILLAVMLIARSGRHPS